MSDSPTHVEVTVPASEPEPASDTPVTVVTTETGSNDALTGAVIEQAGEIAELGSQVDDAESVAHSASAAAEAAQFTAESAIEASAQAVEQVAEMISDAQPASTPDEDIAPKREHWFWR